MSTIRWDELEVNAQGELFLRAPKAKARAPTATEQLELEWRRAIAGPLERALQYGIAVTRLRHAGVELPELEPGPPPMTIEELERRWHAQCDEYPCRECRCEPPRACWLCAKGMRPSVIFADHAGTEHWGHRWSVQNPLVELDWISASYAREAPRAPEGSLADRLLREGKGMIPAAYLCATAHLGPASLRSLGIRSERACL